VIAHGVSAEHGSCCFSRRHFSLRPVGPPYIGVSG
jgi:hypothetical protein